MNMNAKMKGHAVKLLSLLWTVLCGMLSFAQEIPDLTQYADLTGRKPPLILFEDFEGKAPGWKFPAGCRIAAREGMTGSKALVIERTDENYKDYDRGVASFRLKVNPGTTYRVSGYYRTQGIHQRLHMNFSASVLVTRNGKYHTICNPGKMYESTDWKHFEFFFSGTSEIYETDLILRLFYETSGRIYFDNIRVERADSNQASFVSLRPSQLKLDHMGKVLFKLIADPKNLAEGAVIIEGGGTRKMSLLKDGKAEFTLGGANFKTFWLILLKSCFFSAKPILTPQL